MAVKKPAPRCSINTKSDRMLVVASLTGMSADTDLTAGFPHHSAQRVTLSCTTSATAVVTDEDDVTHTIVVPGNASLVLQRPIKTLVKSGSGAVQAICEWFAAEGGF